MIQFTVDTKQINRLVSEVLKLSGKLDKVTAIAMSESAKDAKEALASKVLPLIKGGPTPWTTRGLRYWRADRTRQQSAAVAGIGVATMTAAAGWNYGDNTPADLGFTPKGIGTPSGRYMEIQSRGGTRVPKSTERSLRAAGILRNNQFIIPSSKNPRLDSRGNIPGSEYRRILSRLGANGPQGSTQTTTGAGSRGRTAAKRRKSDYFILRSRQGIAIAHREGDRPTGKAGKTGRPRTVGYQRGFSIDFFISNRPPRYSSKFNIQQIAWATYSASFNNHFRRVAQAELLRLAK